VPQLRRGFKAQDKKEKGLSFNRAGDDLWDEFTLPACLADLCAMVLFVVLTKAEALCEGRGRFENEKTTTYRNGDRLLMGT
jgi:hypothetical protein